MTIGLRLAKPHTNGRGLIHGGLIAALADTAMGYSCAQMTGWTTSFVTISLTVDYVGAARDRQWLAIEGEVIRTGKTICFAQCLVKADGAVIARASGRSGWCRKREDLVSRTRCGAKCRSAEPDPSFAAHALAF